MTEKEYMNVRALSNVLAMNHLLSDGHAFLLETIPKPELENLGYILNRWQNKLFAACKTTE